MNVINRMRRCIRVWWGLFKVSLQIVYGVWKIGKLSTPIVTIFGSARVTQSDLYATKAHLLAEKLVDLGISILTGGGPGIMEAVTTGARISKGNASTLGIGVTNIDHPGYKHLGDHFFVSKFFARKWLLTHYSSVFIIFPGGFGTLDELAEVLTLIQTKQMPRLPIILIGKNHWDDFMQWMQIEALAHKLINKEDLQLFTVTDNIEEVINITYTYCIGEKGSKEKEAKVP